MSSSPHDPRNPLRPDSEPEESLVEMDEELAAAIHMAMSSSTDEGDLPDDLEARLQRDAELFFWPSPTRTLPEPGAERRSGRPAMAVVALAVAAAVLLLFLPGVLTTAASPELLRTALLDEASDAVVLEWMRLEDAWGQQAEGDVVWSDERQEGYMRFRALERNEPTAAQYQLWIFDSSRPDSPPVDGGVFDIVGSAEQVVPIDAALEVDHAYQFAITLERPGGVVVSSQERLLLLAAED